jgi:hypothetical protein
VTAWMTGASHTGINFMRWKDYPKFWKRSSRHELRIVDWEFFCLPGGLDRCRRVGEKFVEDSPALVAGRRVRHHWALPRLYH